MTRKSPLLACCICCVFAFFTTATAFAAAQTGTFTQAISAAQNVDVGETLRLQGVYLDETRPDAAL